jgi:aspartate ammonia-lyase
MRIERDALGQVEIPSDALFGIHAFRARENFPDHQRFHVEWYRAHGVVKRACYQTIEKFQNAVAAKYPGVALPFDQIAPEKCHALMTAAEEVAEGKHFDHFIVPGISGGAGTSINMNINEIITNRALELLGERPGRYDILDPVEHANRFQSTNDVVPTALRIAVMTLLDELELSANRLRMGFEDLEATHRDVLRAAYTQMQKAVPSSFGKLFSTYQESLSRDWWRVSKCFERIKVVNLGGSAVGTGITVPTFFIFEVVEALRRATGKPVTRGDNLQDTTANLDPLVEVHAILKAHAVNLEKIAADLRLLGSEVFGERVLLLSARQVGSSIMPGKVNPVIPEYVISIAHEVYASDALITSLAAQGMLDLNAYLPVIGHHLITTLKHLVSADETLRTNLIEGLRLDAGASVRQLMASPVIVTALLPYIGYHQAARLATRMQEANEDIFEANDAMKLIDTERLEKIMTPSNLMQLGYRMSDILSPVNRDPGHGGDSG